MTALYNEVDPKAAAWLRALIAAGHIAPGIVDERSIEDLTPDYLLQFTQVHFFAGIGVWSYALRAAGWSDDRPVWTASCPCQPFSSAGKGGGFDDERHLWPAVDWLVQQCQPELIFGEQVASKDAEPWLDLVQADLERLGYAFGACAFPSAGVGAPHIRDRSYWVAHANGGELDGIAELRRTERNGANAGWAQGGSLIGARRHDGRMVDASPQRRRIGAIRSEDANHAAFSSNPGGMAHHHGLPVDEGRPFGSGRDHGGDALEGTGFGGHGEFGWLAHADGGDAGAEREQSGGEQRQQPQDGGPVDLGGHADPNGAGAQGKHGVREMASHAGPVNGGWGNADWIYCRNGEWRPVEPKSFPLAHGSPARVGRLRGYGNALNAEAAALFIACYLDATVI